MDSLQVSLGRTYLLSPGGSYVLHVSKDSGKIWSISVLSTAPPSPSILETISFVSTSASQAPIVRWAPVRRGDRHETDRFLIADRSGGSKLQVYEVQEGLRSIDIHCSPSVDGTISNVEFGSIDSDLLIWPSHQQSVIGVSLSGQSAPVEIKAPKAIAKSGRGSCNLAVLSRPETRDILTIHSPASFSVLATVELPTTDAAGLKWSPNGVLLAVWDAASHGLRVSVYTADGHLYREYAASSGDDDGKVMGVKCIAWCPDNKLLAVGAHDNTVQLISTTTMAVAVEFEHPSTINAANYALYVEQPAVEGTPGGIYASPAGQYALPASATAAHAISAMAFNAEGGFLATRDDAHPTAIFVWTVSNKKLQAIIVQRDVVESFSWHHASQFCLVFVCGRAEPTAYAWDFSRVAGAAPPQCLGGVQEKLEWVGSKQC